mgnify:CR=1 FL=1
MVLVPSFWDEGKIIVDGMVALLERGEVWFVGRLIRILEYVMGF